MDKDYVIKMLWMIQHASDKELAHIEADRILCEFLTSLGHQDIVDAYFNIEKWYA